jgi:hypothetical protein
LRGPNHDANARRRRLLPDWQAMRRRASSVGFG